MLTFSLKDGPILQRFSLTGNELQNVNIVPLAVSVGVAFCPLKLMADSLTRPVNKKHS
jgi:hypothetical protein